MEEFFDGVVSKALLLYLVMDAPGSLPLFVSALKGVSPKTRKFVIIRESLVALVILAVFMLFGRPILNLLHISESSMGIAGGIVLMLISIKMIFLEPATGSIRKHGIPLIFPLAVPMLAGPAAISTLIVLRGPGDINLLQMFLALLTAWFFTLMTLLVGDRAIRFFGAKLVDALQALLGLILSVIAVEMLVNGIKSAFKL